MKLVTFEYLHEEGVAVESIKNSGFDLVVSSADGTSFKIEDGLTELVTSQAQLKLSNGTFIDYKTLVEKLVLDEDSIKTLDINFVGDSHAEEQSEDQEGTGVEEGLIDDLRSALAKILTVDNAPDADEKAEQGKADEISEEEIEKSLADALAAAQEAKAEQELQEEGEKEASEEESKDAEKAAEESEAEQKNQKSDEQGEKQNEHVEDMKNELRVEKIETNENTSTQTGDYDAPPAPAFSSNNSGKFKTEGKPKEEETYEFTVKLEGSSDSGKKGDFITNVGEPVFVGTGTPSTIVTVSVDGTDYSATVDAEGKWTLPPIPDMEEGEYAYSAKDSAGNKTSGTLVIDQTNTLTHELENDTGKSGSDNVTMDSRLIYVGKTDPGSKVSIRIGGTEYETTANANGDYSLTVVDGLQDGSYEYDIVSEDVAGNIVTATGTVVIDTTIEATVGLSSDMDTGASNKDGITKENENLILTGHIEEGAEAQLHFNGETYPVQILDDGSWSVKIDGELPDDDYEYRLDVKDVAGNHEVLSGTIVVDTQTSITGGLDKNSDTGKSNSDGLTMETKPVFSGDGEPKGQVVLFIDNREYTTTVDSAGQWQVQVTDELSEGTYPYRVVITDVAGNTHEISKTMTVDTGVTVVADLQVDTGVSDSDGITNLKNNTIVGKTEAGATGTITGFNNGNSLPLTINPDGSFVFETGDLNDGTYEYAIDIIDKAGNTVSLNQSLTVDTSTFVEGSLDTRSDSGSSNSDSITNDTTPTISGTGEPKSVVVVTIDDIDYETTVDSGGKWSLDVTHELQDGDYTFTIKATDIAGNIAHDSGELTIDTKTPQAFTARLDNDSGESDSDWITNKGLLALSGTVEYGSQVVVMINNRTYGQNDGLVIKEDGTWSFELPNTLGKGDYLLELIATDVAGNTSTIKQDLVVDTNTSITGSLASDSDSGESNSDNITSNTTPTFRGVSEANSTVVVNAADKDYAVKTDESGRWEVTLDSLQDGVHVITMTVTDKAGNTATVSEVITVDTVDPVESTISLKNDTGESARDFITKNNIPSLQGQAEAGVKVDIRVRFANGEEYKYSEPDIAVNKETGEWSFVSPIKFPDGTHELSVISTDRAGNESVKKTDITIDTEIDLTASLDSASDSGVKADKITNEQNPVFKGTGTAGDSVTLNINGNSYSTTIDKEGTWSLRVEDSLPHRPDQAYEYEVVVVDTAGNTTSKTDSLIIDTETKLTGGLDSTSDSGSIDGVTNDNTPLFSGQAESGATVVLDIEGKIYETVADDRGRWSIQINTSMSDKKYDYTITATDIAGNTDIIRNDITVDTTTSVSGGLDASSDSGAADSITKFDRPYFSGKGEVGSAVTVTINGKDYDTIVDHNGDWKVQVTDSLIDDDYSYQINAVDIAGNKATLPEGKITIDTSTSVTGGLAVGFDTGESNSDRITKYGSPKFSGTGELGGTVTIVIDGREYNKAVDSNGQWEIDGIHKLADGIHEYEIKIVDVAGNTASIKNDVSVDTTPPAYTPARLENDTGDNNTDMITKDGNLVFVGQVENADIAIELRIDGKVYRSPQDMTVTEDGAWRMEIPEEFLERQDGYDFTVTYTDVAGNPASQSGTVVVDTSNSITGGLDFSSDSGGKGDSVTRVTKPTFSGMTESNATITLMIDGQEYTTKANRDGEWSIQCGHNLSDNEYSYTIVSEDIAGNRKELLGEVTVDTSASSLANITLDNDSNIERDWITKNAEPEWSGQLEAGTELTITISGNGKNISLRSPDNFTVDKQGNWSVALGEELSDGSYRVKFDALDKAGNPSSIEHTLEVDTTISLVGSLSSSSDTGESDSDNITSNNTPTFSGSGEVGATVTLTIDSKELTTVVGDNGRWSIVISDTLRDATYPVEISIKDVAGNEKSLPTTHLTIDTTDPIIESVRMSSDTGEDTGDGITKENSPSFVGKVEPNTRVVLEIGGQRYTIPSDSIDSDGNWSFTVPTELRDGDYTWKVVVIDTAGNTSDLDGDITIDTSNQLSGGLSVESDTGASSSDGLTNSRTPDFNGKTDPNSIVTLRFGDGTEYTNKADSDGNWSINVAQELNNGRHDYELISVDIAGNEKSIRNHIVVDYDKPPVTVKLVNDTGESDSDGVTKSRTPIFSGTSEDGATIELTINGITYSEPAVKVNEKGVWSFVLPIELQDGGYKVEVVAVDKAGNTATENLDIVIDNAVFVEGKLKSSSDTGTDDSDNITKEQLPEFEGRGDVGATITFSINGKEYTTKVDEDKKWELAVTDPIPEGTHKMVITIEDKAGNIETIEDEITIDRTAEVSGRLDTSSDSGLSNTDKVTSDNTPLFSGTSENGSKVTLTINGVSKTVDVGESGQWELQWDQELRDGREEVEISVVDIAGNTNSFVDYITIDTTKPEIPEVTLVNDSGLSSIDGITSNDRPELSGVVSEGESVTLIIDSQTFASPEDIQINEAGRWTFRMPVNLNDDVYDYTVIVEDLAGNTSQMSDSVTVDTTFTMTVGLADESDSGERDDFITNEQKPTFEGDAEKDARIVIEINGKPYETIAGDDGKWSIIISDELDHGNHPYTIKGTDVAGNEFEEKGNLVVDIATELRGGLDASSNSGSKSDLITNSETTKFSGTGESGAKLAITINNETFHTEVDEYGRWEFTVPEVLDEGSYKYVIIATDTAGNTAKLEDTVVIDRTNFINADLKEGSDTGTDKIDGITRDDRPTFVGTTQPETELKLIINNSTSYDIQVNADGSFEFQIPSALLDDRYDYVFVSTDAAGNRVEKVGILTVDTKAELAGGLDEDSDSGLTGDRLTNNNTPEFSGTGEAGASVVLNINNKDYTTTVSQNGTWSITIPAGDELSDNKFKYTVKTVDVAGNEKTIEDDITVDTSVFVTAQLVNDTGYDNNDGITSENQPTFSGEMEVGASISIRLNNKTYTTDNGITVNPDGSWEFTVPEALPDDSYNWVVNVVDSAGNTDSATGAVVVDTTDPNELSVNLTNGSVSDDNITKNAQPEFSGRSEAGTAITVRINGEIQPDNLVSVNSDGTWSFTTSTELADDEYVFEFISTDAAGNTQRISHNLEIDTSTTVTGGLDDSSNSGDKSDLITNSEALKFSGTGEAASTIEVTINSTIYRTIVKEDGSWSLTMPSKLDEGSFNYEIVATDTAGNTDALNDTIVIDRTNTLSVSLNADSDSGRDNSDGITNVKQPTFTGSTQAGSSLQLILNGGTPYDVVIQDDGTFSFQVPTELTDGEYSYVFVSIDVAGNRAESPGRFEIDSVAEITGGIDESSDSGDKGDRLTKTNTPKFSGTGEPEASIVLTINETEHTTTVDPDGTWSIQIFNRDSLPDDSYNYTIKTIDKAGNENTVRESLVVDSVITLNAAMVSDTGHDATDGITQSSTPSFRGDMEIGAIITITINGKSYGEDEGVVVNSDGTWSFTLPAENALPDGDYNWTVHVIDAAGNTLTARDDIQVDTTDPTLLTVDLLNGSVTDTNITKNTMAQFGGRSEVGTDITVKMNGQAQSTSLITVNEDDGTWSFTVAESLSDEDYVFEFISTDAAGNSQSVIHNLKVDTTTSLAGGLDNSSNTGQLDDLITNSEEIKFSGTGEAGSKVEISVNHKVYETTVQEEGGWSFILPERLEEGRFDYEIVLTDKAGNTEKLNDTIEIDRTNSITAGMKSDTDSGSDNADGITNNKQPTFIGSTQVGSSVTLVINGTTTYPIVVKSDGSFEFEIPTELSDDNYTYEFISVDAAGNRVATDGKFTIDTVAELTGGLDEESDTGIADDQITRNDTPKFSGTGEPRSSIKLVINGNRTYRTEVDENGSWSIELSDTDKLPQGKLRYSITTVDLAGNPKTIEDHITIDTETNVTAKLVTDTGSDSNDGITQTTTPQWTGTMESGSTITLSINHKTYTVNSGIVVNTDGSWSFTLPNSDALVDGDYEWVVNVTDKAGNTNQAKDTIQVDTTDPTELSVNLTNGSVSDETISKNPRPQFGGNSEAGTTISVSINGALQPTYLITVNPDGTWSFEADSDLSDGDYVFDFVSTDMAGNTQTITHNLEIDTSTAVAGKLSVTSDSGSDSSDSITNSKDIEFDGTGEIGAKIILNINGQDHDTVVDTDGRWSITVGELVGTNNNRYDYTITATDKAGNNDEDQGFIIVDTVDPIKPEFELLQGSDSSTDGDWITNSESIILKGVGESGATLSVKVGTDATRTLTVGDSGEWQLDLEKYPEGIHLISITATDSAGNTSSHKETLIIDRSISLNGRLDETSDSGSSNTDNYTREPRPIFSGNTDPSSEITITITLSGGSAVTLTTTADENGLWRTDPSQYPAELLGGTYEFEVVTLDKAGNTTSFKDSFVVDREISLTLNLDTATNSGSTSDSLTNFEKPRFSGVGQAGDIVVTKVFNADGDLIETINSTVVANGSWTADVVNSLIDGVYRITADATDKAGNAISQETSITVDITPPEGLEGGLDDTTNSGSNSDTVTRNNMLKFSGSVEVGCTVELTFANGSNYKAIVDNVGNWSLTMPEALVDGTHQYTIIATDNAGNRSTLDREVTVDRTINLSGDMDAQSDTGWSENDYVTNNNRPTLTGSTDAFSVVKVTLNTVPPKEIEVIAGENGDYTLELGDLFGKGAVIPDGTHSITISAIDPAGNTDSFTKSLIVDTVKPTDLIVGLSDGSDSNIKGDFITNDSTPVLIGSIEAEDMRLKVIINEAEHEVTISADGSWQFAIPELIDGTHKVVVVAEDKAGNESRFEKDLIVDTKIPDGITGRLASQSDYGADNNDGITNIAENLRFTGDAEPNATVLFVLNGKTYTAAVDADGKWDVVVPDKLEDGPHTGTVQVTDKAGNTGTKSVKFTIDTKLPELSGIGLHKDDDTGDDKTDGITNKPNPSVVGQVSEDASEVWIVVDGSSKKYPAIIDNTGAWTSQLSSLGEGKHTYTVHALDIAGNPTSSSGHEVTIDTKNNVEGRLSASMDSGSSSEDGITNERKPSFNGKTDVGNTVFLIIKDKDGTTVFDDQQIATSEEFEFKVDTNLRQGDYEWDMYAVDKAGNNAYMGGKFTIDTMSTTTAQLSEASDTGVVGDKITNKQNPVLSGKAEDSSSITVTVTGLFSGGVSSKTYKTQANASGDWTLAVDDTVVDGKYTYEVIAVDKAGNASDIVADEFFVDRTPQNVVGDILTDSGEPNDRITNGVQEGEFKGHLDFTGTTSDGGSRIIIKIGGRTFETVSKEDGTWEYVISEKLSDGNYEYTIIAEDAAGNQSDPVVDTVTLDTTITTTPNLHQDHDTGEQGDNRTKFTKPTISGFGEKGLVMNATLSGGGLSNHSLGQITTDEEGKWTLNIGDYVTSGLIDGAYTIKFDAEDIAGNQSDFTYRFTVDSTPPIVTLNKYNASEVTTDKPKISGSGEVGAKVTLHIDGEDFSTTIDSAGQWSFSSSEMPSFPDGEVNYSVYAVDKAGNRSDIVDDTITINTGTYVDGGIDEATDTGFYQTDGVTQNRTPIFMGSGESGGQITITIKDEAGLEIRTLTTTVPRNGMWEVALEDHEALDDGRYTYEIKIEDSTGNVAKIEDNQLVVDNEVNIDSVRPWSSSWGGASVGDTWYLASSSNSIRGQLKNKEMGAQIIVEIAGQPESPWVGVSDKNGSFNVQLNLPDGDYNAKLTALDVAGNETSTQVKINVDSSTDWSLTNESDVSGHDTNWIVSSSRPKIVGEVDPKNGARVHIKFFGEQNPSYDAVIENGKFVLQPNEDIPDGTYSYRIIYWEKSGRWTEQRGTIIIDTVNEIISLSEVEKEIGDDNSWSSTKITGFGEPNASITVTLDGVIYTTKVSSNGKWSVSVPISQNGSFEFNVNSKDKAGNEVNLSNDPENRLEVDFIQKLDIDLTDGEVINPSQNPLKGSGDIGNSIEITITDERGNVFTKYAVVHESGTWSADLSDLPDGQYTVEIEATSKWGKKVETINIEIDATDPTISDVTLENDTGLNGDGVTSDKKPILTGIVSADTETVTITLGAASYTSEKDFTVKSDGSWRFTIPVELEDGKYDYVVNAVDKAGNTTTHNNVVEIQSKAPTISEVKIGDSVMVDGKSVITKSGADFTGTVDANTSKITITLGATVLISGRDFVINPDGSWSINLPLDINEGSHTMIIQADNKAGLSTHETLEFDYDKTAPVIESVILESDTGLDGDGITATNYPEFSGKVEAGTETVTITIAGVTYQSGVAFELSKEGHWSFTVPQELSDGNYTYHVVAMDKAGNDSRYENTVSIKSQAPNLSEVALEGAVETDSGLVTNDPNSELTGKADNNTSKLTVKVGNVELISGRDFLILPDGSWKIDLPKGLTEGHHKISVIAENEAGLKSELAIDFEVDLTPPQGTGRLDLTANDFVGEDTISNSNPVFKGTGEVGATVLITLDGKVHPTVVDRDGNWSLEVTDTLLNDKYLYVIEMVDKAGNKAQIDYDMFYVNSDANLAPQAMMLSSSDSAALAETPRKDISLNETNSEIKGVAEYGDIMTVNIHGQSTEAAADFSGNWSIPMAGTLPEGAHAYTITKQSDDGSTELIQKGLVNVAGSEAAHVANVEVGVVDDVMVLSGLADANSEVIVDVAGNTTAIIAGETGEWSMTLDGTANDVVVTTLENGTPVKESVDTSKSTAYEADSAHAAKVSNQYEENHYVEDSIY